MTDRKARQQQIPCGNDRQKGKDDCNRILELLPWNVAASLQTDSSQAASTIAAVDVSLAGNLGR